MDNNNNNNSGEESEEERESEDDESEQAGILRSVRCSSSALDKEFFTVNQAWDQSNWIVLEKKP